MSVTRNRQCVSLRCEALELREVPAVISVSLVGDTLVATTNNTSTTIEVRQSGGTIQIKDVLPVGNAIWSWSSAGVALVELRGGTGNDTFTSFHPTMPMRMLGHNGNDTLTGNAAADDLQGGMDNDTLFGNGGNDTLQGDHGRDTLRGEDGDDVIRGGDDNDTLDGGPGKDELIGQGGTDALYGEVGNDILVGIDGVTSETVDGGGGEDTIWVDGSGPASDIAVIDAEDHVQWVSSFANGVDLSLNGDRIVDPMQKAGHVYAEFAGNPLFGVNGARQSDIDQGQIPDCWLLSGLGALAEDNRGLVKQNVVDFRDGTYGVHLGDNFYRVDNDLPVAAFGSPVPVYAKLGADNSMWVAIVEKAYAHHRSGLSAYGDLAFGNPNSVYAAFGATPHSRGVGTYANATDMANDFYTRWNTDQSVAVSFGAVGPGAPVVGNHVYMLESVTRDANGVVTSITLRNPMGQDGSPHDGDNQHLVTLTPDDLFRLPTWLHWCNF